MSGKAIAISRGVAVIGGTAALMIAATFAAYTTNTVTLSANLASVTTADVLQISNGGPYATSVAGITASSVAGVWTAPQPFYLKNTSGANLGITACVPNNLNLIPTGFSGWNNALVKIVNVTTGDTTTTDLQALQACNVAITGSVLTGAVDTYSISYQFVPAGITGTGPTSAQFDLDFAGTAL